MTLRYTIKGNILIRLIIINVAIFILLGLSMAGGNLFSFSIEWTHEYFSLSSDLNHLLYRPWTIVSYMFTHYDFIHLLFNMLWLYWFGEVLLLTMSKYHILSLYLIGGLCGAFIYETAYNLIPAFQLHTAELCGASAAILAIMTAAAFRSPDYRFNLLFIGAIKLKWIAIISIILVFIGIGGTNKGGELAHLGGVIAGTIFGFSLRKGYDILKPLNALLKIITSPKRRQGGKIQSKKFVKAMEKHQSDVQRLDALLDKITKSGYNSLSAKEQKELKDLSNNLDK